MDIKKSFPKTKEDEITDQNYKNIQVPPVMMKRKLQVIKSKGFVNK